MESIIDNKDHVRPAHNALNTDTVKDAETTPEEEADRRMNEVANKAAGRGLERQRQDESDNIISK